MTYTMWNFDTATPENLNLCEWQVCLWLTVCHHVSTSLEDEIDQFGIQEYAQFVVDRYEPS